MSKNVIFCWSGTGNCLTMAKIIAGELGDTDIIMARKKPARLDVTDAERVGFVFPCHGGGAPVDFLEYLKDVKISPNAYTFAVSQSASYAGIGLHFPHWIMIPPMPASLATKLADKKAVSIAKDVLAGARTEKKPPKNPLNVIENAGWSTVTKLVTRGFKVSDKCIGCGQCVELCPREHQAGKRQGRHRQKLHPVSGMPAVLPAGGHLHHEADSDPQALHQQARQGKGSQRRGHSYQLIGQNQFLSLTGRSHPGPSRSPCPEWEMIRTDIPAG